MSSLFRGSNWLGIAVERKIQYYIKLPEFIWYIKNVFSYNCHILDQNSLLKNHQDLEKKGGRTPESLFTRLFFYC